MLQNTPYQIYAIGDQGITLDYGGEMNELLNKKIFQLYTLLKKWQPEAILDIIPAYHSISLIYDLIKVKKLAGTITAYQFLEMKLRETEAQLIGDITVLMNRTIEIPVCYDVSLAPDLDELAKMHHLSHEEIIEIHIQQGFNSAFTQHFPKIFYWGCRNK